MLFMVIERFRNHDPAPIAERFKRSSRMLPDGVTYHASWVEPAGDRCFQMMEARSADPLDTWISSWTDLVEFEVVPVVTSAEFWS